MTIIERIESKNAKIQKLEALIERKRQSIAKATDSYRVEVLEREIEDRQKDILDLKKEIEELRPVLDAFLKKQDMIGDLRKVLGPFMDDLEKSWNEYDEHMLDIVTPGYERVCKEVREANYQNYFDQLASMSREEASEAYGPYAHSWYYKGISEREWDDERPYQKKSICRRYAEERTGEDIKRAMTNEFGVGYGKYIINFYDTKEKLLERFRKDNHTTVENLVLDLQNRIAYKVGEITDYSHLKVGMKALNGTVEGQLGTCRVESILAGGYNIQRLHVRVLVK